MILLLKENIVILIDLFSEDNKTKTKIAFEKANLTDFKKYSRPHTNVQTYAIFFLWTLQVYSHKKINKIKRKRNSECHCFPCFEFIQLLVRTSYGFVLKQTQPISS